jgi:uncharacterized membrane protein YgcG
MNRLSRAALLAVTLIFILPTAQASFPEEPAEEWYVLDAAGVLDNQTEMQMSSELSDIRNRTNTLVRVVTIESMADYGVDEGREYFMGDGGYARQMFQHYNMEGNEEKALLITFSEQDRKFRFVMPDHEVPNQQRSGEVYENEVKPYLAADLWKEGTWLAINNAEYIIEDVPMVPVYATLAVILIPLMISIALVSFSYMMMKPNKNDGKEARKASLRITREITRTRGMKVMEHLEKKESGTFQMEFLDQLNSVLEAQDYRKELIEHEKAMSTAKKYVTGSLAKVRELEKSIEEFDKANIGINTRADEFGISYELPLDYAEVDSDLAELKKYDLFSKYSSFGQYSLPLFPIPIVFIIIVLGIPRDIFSALAVDDFIFALAISLIVFGIGLLITFLSRRELRGPFLPMAWLVNKTMPPMPEGIATKGWSNLNAQRSSSGMMLMGMTTALIISKRWNVSISGVDEYGNNMYGYKERRNRSNGSGGSSGGGSSGGGGGCGGGGCGGGGDF